MLATVVLLIATALVGKRPQVANAAVAAEGENAADFRILCSILAVAQQPLPDIDIKPDTHQIVTDAKALNISLHHREATDELTKDSIKDKSNLSPTGAAAALVANTDFTTAQTLAKAAKKLAENTEYGKIEAKTANAAFLIQIKALIKEIDQVNKDIKQLNAGSSKAEIQKLINRAVYGTDEPNDSIKLQEQARGNGRGPSCGTPGNANEQSAAGSSLKHDLLSLCAKGSAIADGKACTNSEATLSKDGSGTEELQEDWKIIKKICKPADASLTAAALVAATKTAVATIASRTINGGKTSHILGKVHATGTGGCDSTETYSSNKGQCVYYDRGTDTSITYPIAWASNLETAVALLEQASNKAGRAVDLMSKLKFLNETLAALSIASSQPNPETTAPATNRNSQNNKLTKIDCAKLTTNKTCTEAGCKWNSTDKSDGDFCKPKDGEGQTNTPGTGEQAKEETATATGCARHKDKTTCENAKKDDKQNCAFRKGKEGEPEPEKEMCLDSSSLVNKKLALMAAAFMRLFFNCSNILRIFA
uniref:Variant surface glycoprotein 793 n=1 Tax=Trypanosoma brucei TaxID=5691 RepID=M4T2D1_9TRYP|nr:variant surface glycoprotein 793 [Trypanosoma brucei]